MVVDFLLYSVEFCLALYWVSCYYRSSLKIGAGSPKAEKIKLTSKNKDDIKFNLLFPSLLKPERQIRFLIPCVSPCGKPKRTIQYFPEHTQDFILVRYRIEIRIIYLPIRWFISMKLD